MKFTIYEISSGKIMGNVDLPEAAIDLNVGEGQSCIMDWHSSDEFYIADGQAIAKATKPGTLAEYDYSSKVWIEKPDEELAAAKAQFMDHINLRSNQMRQPFITKIEGQTTIYQLKKEEAVRFMKDINQTAIDYPLIFAEVGITADTAENVAQVYLQLNDMFMNALAISENIRLGFVNVVEASSNVEHLAAVKESFDLACDVFMTNFS